MDASSALATSLNTQINPGTIPHTEQDKLVNKLTTAIAKKDMGEFRRQLIEWVKHSPDMFTLKGPRCYAYVLLRHVGGVSDPEIRNIFEMVLAEYGKINLKTVKERLDDYLAYDKRTNPDPTGVTVKESSNTGISLLSRQLPEKEEKTSWPGTTDTTSMPAYNTRSSQPAAAVPPKANLLENLLRAGQSKDMAMFESQLTNLVMKSPTMYTLNCPGCYANNLFRMVGGDKDTEISAIFENVLAKHTSVNGGLKMISKLLHSATYRASRDRAARDPIGTMAQESLDTEKLLLSAQLPEKAGKTSLSFTTTATTASTPSSNTRSSQPVTTAAPVALDENLKRKLARFDALSKEARNALKLGNVQLYSDMMAKLNMLISTS